MISLQSVTFSYPSSPKPVFNDLTFTVDKHSWLVIAGPNGSGKTTLCKLLKGMLRPTSGRIVFGDTITQDQVGYLGGDPYDSLVGITVQEDVIFGLENLGLSQPEMEERLRTALEWTGLQEMGNRLVHTLSGGEQQKLALAGVLAMGSKILIIDEALSMLDKSARAAIHHLMDELRKEKGLSVIEASTSNFTPMADRIIFLLDGKIAFDSTLKAFSSSDLGRRWNEMTGGVESLRRTLACALSPDLQMKCASELMNKSKEES